MSSILGFKLELAYSMRGLAKLIDCGWDHKKLQRVLKDGGVVPRPDGKVWISDITDNMRHFFDSLAELRHQKELAKIRLKGGSLDTDGD